MVNNLPFISIIIPCRNEEKFIARCLDSIISNDYPKDKLEILVVDGMSEDSTRKIVAGHQKQHAHIKLLKNPKKITPCALNIGVSQAEGEIIMKMDAHATYEKDYISKCLRYLKKYKADNVGGILKILPSENTPVARGISLCLSSRFGAGNSYLKTGAREPIFTDSVAFGCYKREVFEKIGTYDERMARSQDFELNLRLKKAGGKILLVPNIVAHYYPKANFIDFFKHNFVDGFWVFYPLKFGKVVFSWRHLIPFFFVLGSIGVGVLSIFFPFFLWLLFFISILYLLFTMYFSIQIALNQKDLKYLFLMPIVFANRHISYGLGSIYGLLKVLISIPRRLLRIRT